MSKQQEKLELTEVNFNGVSDINKVFHLIFESTDNTTESYGILSFKLLINFINFSMQKCYKIQTYYVCILCYLIYNIRFFCKQV